MVASARRRRGDGSGPFIAARADMNVPPSRRQRDGTTCDCRRHLRKGCSDINKCGKLASRCTRRAGHDEWEQSLQQSDLVQTLAACTLYRLRPAHLDSIEQHMSASNESAVTRCASTCTLNHGRRSLHARSRCGRSRGCARMASASQCCHHWPSPSSPLHDKMMAER